MLDEYGRDFDSTFENTNDHDDYKMTCAACGYVSWDTGWPTSSDQGHENLCCGQAFEPKDRDCGMGDCIVHGEELHYGSHFSNIHDRMDADGQPMSALQIFATPRWPAKDFTNAIIHAN